MGLKPTTLKCAFWQVLYQQMQQDNSAGRVEITSYHGKGKLSTYTLHPQFGGSHPLQTCVVTISLMGWNVVLCVYFTTHIHTQYTPSHSVTGWNICGSKYAVLIMTVCC